MSLARAGAAVIVAYQRAVSPFLPQGCRFAPTCSEYARLALLEHGVLRGMSFAIGRLMRCHPFNPGGFDPPPGRTRAMP
jgi:putative membrane protein insertion efficiency factor